MTIPKAPPARGRVARSYETGELAEQNVEEFLKHKTPVFERARSFASNPAVRIGLDVGTHTLNMRRTEADNRPPRSTVTARLMGDPTPMQQFLRDSRDQEKSAPSISRFTLPE